MHQRRGQLGAARHPPPWCIAATNWGRLITAAMVHGVAKPSFGLLVQLCGLVDAMIVESSHLGGADVLLGWPTLDVDLDRVGVVERA